MRKGMTVATVMLAATGAGAALAGDRMAGFEEIARTAERAEVTGLSGWYKGKFRIDAVGLAGDYRIDSRGDRAADEETRFGGSRFTMAGAGTAGTLSGRCWYDMANQRAGGRIGDDVRVTLRTRTTPLLYHCEFARDGAAIGTLTLREVPSRSLSVRQERAGEMRVGDARLDLASVHRFGTGSLPTASPVGYTLAADDGIVGAVDLNGGRKRLALPRDPQLREAALLGSMALALFRDPGDGDE